MVRGFNLLGGIKSIQRGYHTFSGANTSESVTIAEANRENAILRCYTSDLSAAIGSAQLVSGEITNDTTLTLSRNSTAGATTPVVYWEVVEFESVKNIQRGIHANSSASRPDYITITAVNLSKSMVFINSRARTGVSFTPGDNAYTLGDLEANRIKVYNLNSNTSNKTIDWQVVEFN